MATVTVAGATRQWTRKKPLVDTIGAPTATRFYDSRADSTSRRVKRRSASPSKLDAAAVPSARSSTRRGLEHLAQFREGGGKYSSSTVTDVMSLLRWVQCVEHFIDQ